MNSSFFSELDIMRFINGFPLDIRIFFTAALLLLIVLGIKRMFAA